MDSCCREIMEPSIKFARMITLLKILGFINVPIVLSDIFIFGTGFFIYLLIQLLALLIGISSKYFGYYLFFILYGILIIGSCLGEIGTCLQIGDYNGQNYLSFGFISFIFIFEIFCIYVIFQVYKQSKHEFRINFGYAPEDNINRNNERIDIDIEGLNNNNFNNEGNNNGNNNNENNNQD